MESFGKQGHDRLEHVTATAKRYFECNFCKQGFTNAQALGGHMNIHRNERAKAKGITNPSFSSKSEDYVTNPRNVSSISKDLPAAPTSYYPIHVEAQSSNYLMCYQPASPSNNPRSSHGYNFNAGFLFPRMDEEELGGNLSLGIGPSCIDQEKEVKRGIVIEDEPDLELRLGHNP